MRNELNFVKIGGVILFLLAFSLNVSAQNITVRGTVTDQSGDPLIGASVRVLETVQGAMVNVEGFFELNNVDPNATLEVSFMGMMTETVPINGRNVINITLRDDFSNLDELIVIGYGVRRRALATGAMADISGEQIASLRTTTAMEALQGIIPGVQITRNSGMPGAGTTVTIRGQGTIGSASPLFVVDGVAMSNINFLNPSDIERIDILRDAASTAIYGARAANGVVLVTTRRGAAGQARVNYDGFFGFQNMWRKPMVLNAQQYMFMMDEMAINSGRPPYNWENMIRFGANNWFDINFDGAGREYGEFIWNKLQNGWTGTDWVDEITMRNAPMQSHSLNITGGSERVTYAYGFSYFEQTGIIGGHLTGAGLRRITARMNTQAVLFSNPRHNVVTFGQSLIFSNTRNRTVATGNIWNNDLHSAMIASPMMPVRWEENFEVLSSTHGFGPNLEGIHPRIPGNPVAGMLLNRSTNSGRRGSGNTLMGNVNVVIEPIQNLRFRSQIGINSWFGQDRVYDPIFRLGSTNFRATDRVSMSSNLGASYTWTNTVNYDWRVNNHNFGVLVGTEAVRTFLNQSMSGWRENTVFQHIDHAFLNNTHPARALSDIHVTGTDPAAQGGGLLSFYTRLSYNYASRYIFDAVLRADGSSNFARGNRWGYFPSISGAWNFTEEAFMEDVGWLNFGRLRAGFGQNGNQSIAGFLYSSTMTFATVGYFFGPNRVVSGPMAFPTRVPNPDITWETSEQIGFGLDTRMLRSRLAFNFDWYQKNTRDWLVTAPVLGTTGADAPMINGGDVRNQGIELMLSWDDRVGNLRYGASLSATMNRNRVTRLANAEGIIRGPNNVLSQGQAHVSQVSVGRPIGYFYGFRTDGIFQNQAEVDAWEAMMAARRAAAGITGSSIPGHGLRRPGDIRFVDLVGDGVIDDRSKTMMGSPHARLELGSQLRVEYRGWFANTTLVGRFGMQVMKSWTNFGNTNYPNFPAYVLGRWHGEGTSNRLPIFRDISINDTKVSDRWMHNADFLRITNLTIGYRFDSLLRNVNWLQSASVNMTVNNLHTFTSYGGMDPEIGFGEPGWATGIDPGLYPLPRTVMFGVNLTF